MDLQSIIKIKNLLRLQILSELKRKKLCGDELADIIGKNKNEKLSPGTIYPALKFLKKKKLIIHKRIGRKKIYSLTKQGEKELLSAKKTFKKMVEKLL